MKIEVDSENEETIESSDLAPSAHLDRVQARGRVDSRGRPKAVTSVLKEISAENIEILGISDISSNPAGKEMIALSDSESGALALCAERQKIEAQLNSVYFLATNVNAINDKGQLLLYNPMAALKAVELLIDIKGLRNDSRGLRNAIQINAPVRSIDLSSKSKS